MEAHIGVWSEGTGALKYFLKTGNVTTVAKMGMYNGIVVPSGLYWNGR